MKTFRSLVALLLSILMTASLEAPVLGATIAVVETENLPGFGELVSEDGLVHIAYGEEAGIPDGAVLCTSEISRYDERYAQYMDSAAAKIKGRVEQVLFYDISIVNPADGLTIQPAAPVRVSIHSLQRI